MPLRTGSIVIRFDDLMTPPKPKLVVCVCVAEGWFFRINSKAVWRPNVLVRRGPAEGLDHDSFVHLTGILELDADYEIQQRSARILGRLGLENLRALLGAVQVGNTLKNIERDRIVVELNEAIAEILGP